MLDLYPIKAELHNVVDQVVVLEQSCVLNLKLVVEVENHILPQSRTSRSGFFMTCVRLLLMLVVWTLNGLPAERALTIKSANTLKSQISD